MPMRFSGRTLAVTAGLGLALAWAPMTALAEEAPAEQKTELQGIEVTLPNTEQGQIPTPTVTTPSDVPASGEDAISEDPTMGSGPDAQEPEASLPDDGQTGGANADAPGSLPVEGEGDPADGTQTEDGSTTDDVTSGDAAPEDGVATPGDEEEPTDEETDASETIEAEPSEPALSEPVAPTTPEPAAPQSTQTGWVKEGDGYAYYDANGSRVSGWLVTDDAISGAGSELQRYWLGENGSLVTGLFEAVLDGVSSLFYGTDEGYVVRGKREVYDEETERTYVYLADNDGRLAGGATGGWVVSDDYGQGLQRYWIDDEEHAAIIGYSADGWAHYTTEEGYVLRGGGTFSDGRYWANNDGRLTRGAWVVTGYFTGGELQRYWAGEDGAFARNRLINAGNGYYAYALDDYTVVRGAKKVGKLVYLADNNGRLAGGASGGWVVSDDYGQGLQRYWIDDEEHAAVVGYDDGSEGAGNWAHYTTAAGYVLRGKQDTGKGLVYIADNEGRLPDIAGWYVTGMYDDGELQRYYIDAATQAARSGFFTVDGSAFFGVGNEGYVARGKHAYNSSNMLLADNEGVLFNDASVRDKIVATKKESDQLVSYQGVFHQMSQYDNGATKKYYLRFLSGTDLDGNGTPVIVAGIGFIELDGGKTEYYGSTTEGYIMTGTFTTPTGILVTTDADGKVTSKGTSVVFEALRRLNASYSDTNWAICVDVHAHEVMVFNRADKNSAWTLARQFKCGTGDTAAGHPTFRGELTLGGGWSPSANKYLPAEDRIYKYDYFGAWYYMPYYLDQGFHSVIDGDMDGYVSPSDTASQVGKDISHGCIRCPMDDLKWVWDNVPDGSRVIIYPYSTNGVYYRAGF